MFNFSWRFFISYLLIFDPTFVMGSETPIIHPDVAAVSFPRPVVNVPIAHWYHTFSYKVPCIDDAIPGAEFIKYQSALDKIHDGLDSLIIRCNAQDMRDEELIQPLCTTIKAVSTLVADEVGSFTSMMQDLNNIYGDLNSLLGTQVCREVVYQLIWTNIVYGELSPQVQSEYKSKKVRRSVHSRTSEERRRRFHNDWHTKQEVNPDEPAPDLSIQHQPQPDDSPNPPMQVNLIEGTDQAQGGSSSNNVPDWIQPEMFATLAEKDLNKSETLGKSVNVHIDQATIIKDQHHHYYSNPNTTGHHTLARDSEQRNTTVPQDVEVLTRNNIPNRFSSKSLRLVARPSNSFSNSYDYKIDFDIEKDPLYSPTIQAAISLEESMKQECLISPDNPSIQIMHKSLLSIMHGMSAHNLHITCNILRHQPMCKNSISRPPTPTRSKREVNEEPGMFGWVLKVQKFLYGSLGYDDAVAINQMFIDHANATNFVFGQLKILANSTFSASSHIAEDLNTLRDDTQIKMRALSDNITEWSTSVQDTVTKLKESMTATIFYNLANLAMTQAHDAAIRLGQIILALSRLYTNLDKIIISIRSRSAPYSIIPSSDVETIFSGIRKKLPVHLALPKQVGFNDMITYSEYAVQTTGSLLLFTYKIPLVSNEMDYKTWQITSIPVYVGGVWFKLNTDVVGVNIDEQRQLWQGFTNAELSLCLSNPRRICPFTPPTRAGLKNNCLIGLLNMDKSFKDVCMMKPLTDTLESTYYLLPVTQNSWLYSGKLEHLTATQRCQLTSQSIHEDETVLLSGVTYIQLPEHCTLKLGDVELNYYEQHHYVSSHQLLNTKNHSTGMFPQYSTFKSVWTQLNDTLLTAKLKPLALAINESSDFHVSLSATPIKALESFSRNLSQTNLSALFPNLVPTHHTNNNDLSIWEQISTFFMSILLTPQFFVIQLSLDVVMVVYLTKGCLKSLLVALTIGRALPPEAMRLHSYAAPFQTSLAKIKIVPPAQTSLFSTGDSNTIKTDANPNIVSEHFPKFIMNCSTIKKCQEKYPNLSLIRVTDEPNLYVHLDSTKTNRFHDLYLGLAPHVLMIIVMIFLAVICHHCLVRSTRLAIMRAIQPLGLPPCNKSVTHYKGESRLLLTFIVDVHSWFRMHPDQQHMPKGVYKNITVQAATLPGSPHEWCATSTGAIHKFARPDCNKRWASDFVMTLNWGPICIRRVDNLDLTACESLPTKVKVDMDQIKAGIEGKLPWLWYNMEVNSISSIVLVGLDGYNKIFTSGVTPNGNQLMKLEGRQPNLRDMTSVDALRNSARAEGSVANPATHMNKVADPALVLKSMDKKLDALQRSVSDLNTMLTTILTKLTKMENSANTPSAPAAPYDSGVYPSLRGARGYSNHLY